MKCKLIEIRDAGTFIPALAVLFEADSEAGRYLLGRVGIRPDGSQLFIGMTDNISNLSTMRLDIYEWEQNPRTYRAAHHCLLKMVEEHGWDNLPDGLVVDVQFELGETTQRKESERGDSFGYGAPF